VKKLFIFLSFWLTIALVGQVLKKSTPPEPSKRAALPSPSESPLPAITSHHCLDASEVNTLTHGTFTLTREEYVTEIEMIECQYDTPSQVNNLSPSLHYTYRVTSSSSIWDTTQTLVQKKPSNRRIEGKAYLIADLNPVVELAQVTFYGYKNTSYIEVTYTPVEAQSGDILRVGEQIAEKIFEKG